MCGPNGKSFKKPVIVGMRHCASLMQGPWVISVLSCDMPLGAKPKWKVMLNLTYQTIVYNLQLTRRFDDYFNPIILINVFNIVLTRKFWHWERKRSTHRCLCKWTLNTCIWWAKRCQSLCWSANLTWRWSAVRPQRRLKWPCLDRWTGSSNTTSGFMWSTTMA